MWHNLPTDKLSELVPAEFRGNDPLIAELDNGREVSLGLKTTGLARALERATYVVVVDGELRLATGSHYWAD